MNPTCVSCGTPIAYAGIGRPALYCAEHRPNAYPARPLGAETAVVDTPLELDRNGIDRSWHAEAACASGEHDYDLWFPARLPSQRNTDYSRAQAVCVKECPVRLQCLDYALRAGETEGVWGGMTPSQRHALRRRSEQEGAA